MSLQIRSLSSALEHAIPEQMFVTPENPGEAVSAVKALQKAAAQGQRIYHITQANMATALPNLRLDAETLGEIRQALNSGKEVITHTDPVSVPGWQGAGYVITDMDTGAGAWKIGGGLNGSFFIGLFIGITLVALLIAAIASGTVLAVASVIAAIGINGAFLSILSLDLSNEEFDPFCFASGILWGMSAVFFVFGLVGIVGSSILAAITAAIGLGAAWDDLPSPRQCVIGR